MSDETQGPDIDTGEPIEELAALRESPRDGFGRGILDRIQRRMFAADSIDFGLLVFFQTFMDYLGMMFEMFARPGQNPTIGAETMEESFTLESALIDVFHNLVASVSDFIPRFITALVVILLGLLVAKIAERVLRTLFDKLRFDDLLGRAGVRETLRRLGLEGPPGQIVARTVYFLLVILFTQSVTRAVGLDAIADAIGAFFRYLPNLLAAFLVFLLGMIASQFLNKAVSRSALESGLDYGPLLGRLVGGLVFFVVIIMAVGQLRVDTEIVRMVVGVLLAGFSLALALSFGLGSRDITRNIVAGFYARRLFTVGQTVEFDGEEGVVASITPTQILLAQAGTTRVIPNRTFVDEVVRIRNAD